MKGHPGLLATDADAGIVSARELARRGTGVPFAGLTVVAALVSVFALLPLGFVFWASVQTGWQPAFAMVFRPRVGELLVNTLALEACTLPLTIALALALAWLTDRTDLPAARFWAWVAVAPLAVPAFVHSYAWISLVPNLKGLTAGVLVSVLAYFPFVYLPVSAQLRRLDPALEDSAASLGQGPWQIFLRVVLPQLRLAITGGSLLVALHLLAEYGLYVMIGFDTFTTAIMDQFQAGQSGAAANTLAGVLVLCCLGLLGLEALMRGGERYARVGSGAPRQPQKFVLGRALPLCLALPAITALLSLGVPLLTLGRWLTFGGAELWQWPQICPAAGQSLALALGGGLLTTIAAAPMAWLSVRAPGRLQRALEASHTYVGSLPGVVVALALVAVTVRIALPLYQTVAVLLLAYGLMYLPRALIGLRASVAQAPVELEQAGMALGRTPFQAMWQITLRLAMPGAAVSFAMVAMGITTELAATLMLAPNGTRTLATEFWSLTSEIDYARAAPYALLMIVLSLPMTLLLHAQSRKLAGR